MKKADKKKIEAKWEMGGDGSQEWQLKDQFPDQQLPGSWMTVTDGTEPDWLGATTCRGEAGNPVS